MTSAANPRLIGCVVALVLGACASVTGPPSDGGGPGAVPPPAQVPATTLPPPDTSFIDIVLEDGTITVAEMERAYLGFVGCLKENGADGQYAYDLSVGPGIAYEFSIPGDVDGTQIGPVGDFCFGSFVGELDILYSDQHPPTEAQRETVRSRMYSCLAAAAPSRMATVPADETYDRLVEIANELASTLSLGEVAVAASGCQTYANFGEWHAFD